MGSKCFVRVNFNNKCKLFSLLNKCVFLIGPLGLSLTAIKVMVLLDD